MRPHSITHRPDWIRLRTSPPCARLAERSCQSKRKKFVKAKAPGSSLKNWVIASPSGVPSTHERNMDNVMRQIRHMAARQVVGAQSDLELMDQFLVGGDHES